MSAAKMHFLQLTGWQCYNWFRWPQCHWPQYLTTHPQTPWHLSVRDGFKLKRAEHTYGQEKVRSPVVLGRSRHHQQHVRWDSEACRPSLKPLPEVAPASAAGMRLPEETHICAPTHTHTQRFQVVTFHFASETLHGHIFLLWVMMSLSLVII